MEQYTERAYAHNRDPKARHLHGASLIWRRDSTGWALLAGRRCFGRVVADSKYAGMWRSALSGGRLSDMANLARAKNAVLMAAERELEWEVHQRLCKPPSKSQENRGVFESAASPVAPNGQALSGQPSSENNALPTETAANSPPPSAGGAPWR